VIQKGIESVEHSEAELTDDGVNAAEWNRVTFGTLRKMMVWLLGLIGWVGAGEP
jgi:hypothetical protein